MENHYETKQAILEEAGLSQIVNSETLLGVADGTNKVFVTTYKPITDSNDDDEIDPTDITVYVNGAPVVVRLVDPPTGTITLTAAPASNAVVTCDYRYSPVSDSYLCRIRDEAEGWINDSMDAIDNVPYGNGIPSSNITIPMTIRKLTRWYAAAQLLTRDYGFARDTALTSKDGANKMAMAEAALAKYIAIGGATGLSDVSAAQATAWSDGELFSLRDEGNGRTSFFSADRRFLSDMGQYTDNQEIEEDRSGLDQIGGNDGDNDEGTQQWL